MPGKMFGVIMAGGRGTRFWPVSTKALPKQFLNLTGEGTMLQQTFSRLRGLCGDGGILVVTGAEHRDIVLDQLPWLDPANLLLEPEGRNTAPCIGWAAEVLMNRGYGASLMVVVPSDHVVDPPEGFHRTVMAAAPSAEEGMLMTIGITPDRPSSAYGYLKRGGMLSSGVYAVEDFREKPSEETAREYLQAGGYYWNAGMFLWRVDRILQEIAVHLPHLAEGLAGLGGVLSPDSNIYSRLPSVSVDTGIMEMAERVGMLPAQFAWSDIGDWPSARKCGVGRGRVIAVDSDECTVWNGDRLTVLMGLSGVSVIQTDRVTLVMSDEYSQDLRSVVEGLEKESPDLV